MKTIKAVLLIILGSFFIATGFAFAGDNAVNQLRGGPSFDGSRSGSGNVPVLRNSDPAAVNKATEVAPEPKPTVAQTVNKWLGEHKTQIVMGAVGAYIGFALVGTLLGACTFGLGFLLVLALAAR